MSLKSNQVKAIMLPSSHYTKTDTQFTPKGTLMCHYALVEFGTKELEEEYETSKGSNFSTVKDGEYKGKPMHFTSQIFEGVSEGSEMIFDWINERLSRTESLEERLEKSVTRKANTALEAKADVQMRKKAQLAKEFGLAVNL